MNITVGILGDYMAWPHGPLSFVLALTSKKNEYLALNQKLKLK